ncbi:hypothetical protein [Nocardia sp. AG03]|uniref:hypothetical protein n=1 Tax=Nocardia sp. AG03 TaxID=3025312 RepID=UPI0024186F8B|nr:hypothetical protein [Nocardia sp. AG03]
MILKELEIREISKFRLYARERELKVRFEPSGHEWTIAEGEFLVISVWPLHVDRIDESELTLDYWEDELVIEQLSCLLYAEDPTGMDVGV